MNRFTALAAKGVLVVVKPGHPHVPGLEGRGRLLEQGARIAAVATGVAQGALDVAVRYAKERESFGKPIIDHQGLAFLLADMAAAVESARATYLYAARLRDAGAAVLPPGVDREDEISRRSGPRADACGL